MGSPINGGAWDLTTPPTTPPAAFGLTTDTFLRITDGTLAVNQPYTIEAWFLMDLVNPNYVGIVTKGRDGGFNDWVGLWVTDTTTAPIHAMALGNLTGGDVVGTTTLVAGRWYYGAVTSTPGNPATRRVFVYDTLQKTDAATNATLTPAVTPPTRVGDDSNGNWLNGRIDEVRFSNVARSPPVAPDHGAQRGLPVLDRPLRLRPRNTDSDSLPEPRGPGRPERSTFTASDCCRVTTSTGGTKTTVTTSDVQMVWDTAFGAGLSELYSEEEANATVPRRGDTTKYNVFSMQVNDGSGWHFERSGGASTLQVVESSPARVRLRQLYDYTASLHLDRTWTVGSYPRMAIDETFVLDSTQDIRGAQGLHPKGETTCADQTFGNTFFCAGNADGTNRFWLVTDNQNTYGDMLAVLYNNTFFGRAGAGGVYEQMFEAGTGANTYFARVFEPSLLSTLVGANRNQYLFYPRFAGLTSSGTQWQPYANEYRNPDNISPVTLGSGWQDANELTGAGDFYNEAEGAYAFDMNPASGLSFDLDGGTFARLRPFFKIRQWRSLAPNGADHARGHESPVRHALHVGREAALPRVLVPDGRLCHQHVAGEWRAHRRERVPGGRERRAELHARLLRHQLPVLRLGLEVPRPERAARDARRGHRPRSLLGVLDERLRLAEPRGAWRASPTRRRTSRRQARSSGRPTRRAGASARSSRVTACRSTGCGSPGSPAATPRARSRR